MQLTVCPFSLVKRHALTIARGTSTGSTNVLARVEHDGLVGLGEMAPSRVTGDTTASALADLATFAPLLSDLSPWEMQKIDDRIDDFASGTAARAALDMALHDWQGQKANLPLWRLWGLDRARIPQSTLTIGINPPEIAAEQTREIQARTGARLLKIKLGSQGGIEGDQAMFSAVQTASLPGTIWRVDANGGWSLDDAKTMLPWLATHGAEYVEQPLAQGNEAELAALRPSPLPIFADESVRLASDIPAIAPFVDGVNFKLMKCGGLREARRIIAVARALNLKVMIGCMGESSLAITAGAHLSPLVDFVDLDSQLNLVDDPFVGASWFEGRVIPTDLPGLGVMATGGVLPC